MPVSKLRFEVVKGETEHITFTGRRVRNPTVLIRMGGLALSKKAFVLGTALILCQVFDGILTYAGLVLLGVHMEGNGFLRQLIYQYGAAPALFSAKLLAVVVAVLFMFQAHRRRWVRPVILAVVLIYLGLALVPWVLLLIHKPSPLPAFA